MSYKNTIVEIDNDYDKIKDFDNDTLFINIYNFWCFANYLSNVLHLGKYSFRSIEIEL